MQKFLNKYYLVVISKVLFSFQCMDCFYLLLLSQKTSFQQPRLIFITSLLIKISCVPIVHVLTFSFLGSLLRSAAVIYLGFLLLQTVACLWVKTCVSNMLSSAKHSPQIVHSSGLHELIRCSESFWLWADSTMTPHPRQVPGDVSCSFIAFSHTPWMNFPLW